MKGLTMPDPVTHAVGAPLAGGAASTIIALIFGIEPTALFAAFVGTWIATAMLESGTFKRSLTLVIIGTVAAGYSVPVAFSLWPEFSRVSLAAIVGFVLVYFHKEVLDAAKEALKRLFGKVGA